MLALPNMAFADVSITKNLGATGISPGATTELGYITLTPSGGSASGITYFISGIPLEFNFNPESVASLNEGAEQDVTIEAVVPEGFTADTYSGTIKVFSNHTTAETSISLTVLEEKNWALNVSSFTKTVDNNKIYGEQIKITNTGNKDLVLNIAALGNTSPLLVYSDEIVVYRGVDHTFGFEIDVPRIQEFGHYAGNFTFTDKDNSTDKKTLDMSLTVKDGIEPRIKEFIFDDVQATKNTTFTIEATDNLNISHVWTDILRTKTWNTTELINNTQFITEHKENESIGPYFFTYDENANKYNFIFTDSLVTGPHYATIKVNDSSGNTAANSTEFQVIGLSAVEYETIINLPSAKKDATHELLTLNYATPVKLELSQMSYAGTFTLSVKMPDGIVVNINNVDEQVSVGQAGDYFIIMNGDSRRNRTDELGGEYNGRLKIIPVDQHVPLQDIQFSGVMVDYPVPVPFSLDFYNHQLSCSVTDTGVLNTSKYTCTIEYPITITQEMLQFPVSLGDKEDVDRAHEAELMVKDGIIGGLELTRNLIVTLFVLFIIIGGYIYKFHPYTRMRIR